ncbi:MAG: peptidoglycan DD-metalloendopeptidase family protein [Cyanobacteria bacterium CRU_2_1]|nr:peptidoglycan DD-metalloendopeptidase family protein [Cyanobacteria bacterium RU_5_0]NJR60418.1 peptidoglycan DD-metalloendopeptidase family protein [Cyanobacteria bacterium CRU_2_1]
MLLLALPVRALPIVRSFYLAETVQDLQQQQQQLDQERSRLNQEQERLQNLEKSAQERLGGLHNNIQVTSAQIAENEKRLKAANDDLNSLQSSTSKAEEQFQKAQFATVARLRYLQRQNLSQGWALLLQSHSLNEFLDRRYQLRLVYQSDRDILTDLKAQASELDTYRNNVAQQKNEISLIAQQLQAQKAQYEAQAQTQQELVNRLRQDRRALEAAEEQLARDSNNLTALIQQRLSGDRRNRAAPRNTGVMGYPSDGVMTSGFGDRLHPILGYTRFHSGVDFGVDYGSPIWAANTGVVIFAGWYGGYGQAVIIDHGNNITTLYGHTEEIYVAEGQIVQKGQVIAAVGSTGLSTGPHLHFEVHLNGEPVDPMAYL